MNETARIFAENIKGLRRERDPGGLQRWAEQCGVSSPQLHEIVAGEPNSTLKTIDRLAQYFRVSPWQLFMNGEDDLAELLRWWQLCNPRDRAALIRFARAQAQPDDS